MCWHEVAVEKLTVEHVVPGTVGGTSTVLTCQNCNNTHGSKLDSHLVNHQLVTDAFQGHGSIPVEISANGKKVRANIVWGQESKKITIVGKASRPQHCAAIESEMKAGQVESFDLTFSFKYSKSRFQKAVLRAGYLGLFKACGYEYAACEEAQIIRRRITDDSLDYPPLRPLIVELREGRFPFDESHVTTTGTVNGVPFYLVILRIERASTKYLGIYLPQPSDRSGEFFSLMERCAQEQNGKKLRMPLAGFFK
jgi:hypothetical protein